uniref:BTB domain-containing protein n=1 Tax=Panagrolaimus sp. ES5 TaxID=591445 RepID=A0AC34FTP1_9BILA
MKTKTSLVYPIYLNPYKKTIVNLYKNCQLTTDPKFVGNVFYTFHIEDVKGDFQIEEISAGNGSQRVPFNKETMVIAPVLEYNSFSFHILTNVEFKNVKTAIYHLLIPNDRIYYLDEFDYFEETIELPKIKGLTFTCLVKKIQQNYVEVVIKNPYKVKIDGKKEDFVYKTNTSGINKTISFIVEPAILEADVTPSDVKACKPLIAMLTSSDGNKIICEQQILAKHSPIFSRIFAESTENFVKIDAHKFSASIISDALEFFCGRKDGDIAKKEMLEFANEYNIVGLKESCCNRFVENATFENFNEFIQIAYDYNLETLKKKCMQILKENKQKIEPSKLMKLPKNILSDLFFHFAKLSL